MPPVFNTGRSGMSLPSGLLFPSGVRICHLPQRFHDPPGAQRSSRAVHHSLSRHIGYSLGRGGAARLIVVETVRRIVAAEYDEVWRKPKLAAKCRAVQLFEQVSPAMAKAQAVLPLECAKQALKGLRGCLYIPISASVPPAPPRLRLRRIPSGRGLARVPIEKFGRWPPSSSRKPLCLDEMTGSTIPWRVA